MATPVLVVIGPTAVGKTAVAMALQDLLGGKSCARLISADSAMVYRGMDIGSAKPNAQELQHYPHELVDIREPWQPYTVAEFVSDADDCVRRADQAGHVPIIAGGTMLYVHRFVHGIAQLPSADPAMRAELEAELRERGGEAMHAELVRLDPRAAANIHPNNPQRLLRALEVIRLTGRSMSELWQEHQGKTAEARLGRPVHVVAVEPDDRKRLHLLIGKRFDIMLQQGFVEELERLHKQASERNDMTPDLPAMRAVGYRQGFQYVAGEISLDEFRQASITATRRLAKRQLTWLRGWDGLHRFTWGEPDDLAQQAIKIGGLR